MDAELLQRLRESSGLRLNREGRWLHQGEPVEHERLALALHRGLHRAPDSRWATRLGSDWAYVAVDDVAYFIRAIAPAGELLSADLIDGRELELDPSLLSIDPSDALYAKLPDGEWARLSRAAQLSLAPLLREEAGKFFLELAGRRYPILDRIDS